MQRVRRSRLLALIAAAVVLFLFISALLARAFSVDGAERSAITAVVQAEGRGDTAAVVARIADCGAQSACLIRVRTDVAALHRPGSVSILTINTSSSFSLTGSTGTARVAWTVGSSLPIVQCLRVRRTGNVLSGLRVELLELSVRIPSNQDCPARF
jgi:hypothetical protein